MGVVLKANHIFKTDISDKETFKELFNELLLKVILHMESDIIFE